MDINYNYFPNELKEREQWILYKTELDLKSKKMTKVPYDIYGNRASSTAPAQWSDFTTAVTTLNNGGNYTGLGFVFTEQDNLVGIDFDNCIKDGVIDTTVHEWIHKLNSYTEYSQSGNGLHVILQANLDTSYKNVGSINKIKVEVYNKSRYFVMTSDIYNGLNGIQARQKELDEFLYKWMEKRPQLTIDDLASEEAKYSDGEIIRKIVTTDKIADIFYNDDAWRSYEIGDGSQSDADIWLCSRIITQTRVPEQIDRILRKSVLYRDKWERDDYRRRTIELALNNNPGIDWLLKTNNDEEDIISKVFRPTWANKPAGDPITLELNGVRCGSAGNLTSIVALAGIGKSSVCEAISSAAINPSADNLGFCITIQNPRVLYIDTERVHSDHWTSWSRVMRRADVKEGDHIDHVNWYAIVTLATVEEKRKLLEELLKKNTYDFVLLDTVADFLTDVNSIEQTAELSNWIRGLANEHEFTAILTIHSNPSLEGSNKARGHLGSELLRRSETVFKLEHDRAIDQRTLTTSFSLGKNRSADVAETYFSWDENKGMFTSLLLDGRGKKGRKGPDYEALANELAGTDWIYTDLVKKIVENSEVSPRTAKNRITDLVDMGHMIKQTDGKYTVVGR
jgi:hypothetical protein